MRAEQYNSPLTGLDWNDTKPNLVLAASIDTTCAVWDASTQQIITQLIAHDKEVFDAGFQYGGTGDVFASTGKDGSVRTFDLRNLDHSTIIYETPDGSPLSRISWNSQDQNFMAILAVNSPKILILDIRSPSVPLMELHHGPGYPVNSCCWAPHSSSHLISVGMFTLFILLIIGDDSSAFVWELSSQSKKSYEAILEFQAEHEINNVCWSKDMPEWVAINYGNTLKALRID
jgi:WD repeat-containing protein 68